VTSLARAEWLRLRKRTSLLVIVLAVPLLAAFFFLAGFASISDQAPFDPAATRARLIAEGYGQGLPPDEAEQQLQDAINNERSQWESTEAGLNLQRERFSFPQGIVTTLASSAIVAFALILLTATTIGDEFGWGTIRTSLLASSRRRSFLAVRLGALALAAAAILVLLVLLGGILPLLLGVAGARPPVTTAVDGGALGVAVIGQLVVSLTVIAFGALVTVLLRSGSLTLVAMLGYVAVEAAILTLLIRFEPFQERARLGWLLDALPVRGISTLTNTTMRAASGLPNFPGETVDRSLEPAIVPIVALIAWAALFAAIAFRRFQRMDIVE
jgi:ABC-type transport system involved in multi-copper enzyme maturation permease subunit